MTESDMMQMRCPFKDNHCYASKCMAARTSGFNLVGNWNCALIPKDSTTEAINSAESPQIPEGYTIRELKS